MKKYAQKNNLRAVIRTTKPTLDYVRETLTDIIASIDPQLILDDILNMDSTSRVAAYLRLAEVNSKLAKDVSSIEKDKFIMSLDKLDENEEIFVRIDNETDIDVTPNATPRMLELIDLQAQMDKEKVDDISVNIETDPDISTPEFENYEYVAPVKVHHSPKQRKKIGY